MKALILAAGYATRLYPLTKDRPKPLLHVAGRTILDHLLDRFRSMPSLDRVYVVTNDRFHGAFASWAEDLLRDARYPEFDVEIINDGTNSNETRLGAIADIHFVIEQKSLADDLLVSAGDNIFTFDFKDMYDQFVSSDVNLILAYYVASLEKLQRSGVMELDADQRVIGFEEKSPQPRGRHICPAVYFYKKSTLPLFKAYLNEGHSPDAPGHFIAWLYRHAKVYAYLMTENYYDIGTLKSYEAVCRALEKQYPS